jgi:hypothetical protein
MDDLAEAAAARDGKPRPLPRWPAEPTTSAQAAPGGATPTIAAASAPARRGPGRPRQDDKRNDYEQLATGYTLAHEKTGIKREAYAREVGVLPEKLKRALNYMAQLRRRRRV